MNKNKTVKNMTTVTLEIQWQKAWMTRTSQLSILQQPLQKKRLTTTILQLCKKKRCRNRKQKNKILSEVKLRWCKRNRAIYETQRANFRKLNKSSLELKVMLHLNSMRLINLLIARILDSRKRKYISKSLLKTLWLMENQTTKMQSCVMNPY